VGWGSAAAAARQAIQDVKSTNEEEEEGASATAKRVSYLSLFPSWSVLGIIKLEERVPAELDLVKRWLSSK
jgi:hypothetical protein